EGQTVSHSMLRMLSKLAHHPSSGGPRARTDPTIRDVMRRLVDDWALDDPNPEAYRHALESMSSARNGASQATNAVATECEPERMIQIAIEVGSMGPQVHAAMLQLHKSGGAGVLLDLVERAPSEEGAAPVWEFLRAECVFESLLGQPRLDTPLLTRFVKRIGVNGAAPALLSAIKVLDDAKMRTQLYDLLQSLGDQVGAAVADSIPDSAPAVQRELLLLLGRLGALPPGFSPRVCLENEEPLVRREAVRLLLRNAAERDETIMRALSDLDDRVVFLGLTAAQEKCPPAAIELIKHRVGRGELDSQLRTIGIRIIAQRNTPETLAWLLAYVVTEAPWLRRPKLRPSSPEMLAALTAVAANWRHDPQAEAAIRLAEQSKDSEVRAKIARVRAGASAATPTKNE
ncbi:MAG TPA: hypothetical protein VK494_04480, partial [Gemmatimonadaceae bacterium]|nr:hypothetical protein [Gemmatimonadaceae bacterium]